jgi:hypothetical protein
MRPLSEIAAEADQLPPKDKQELIFRLARGLKGANGVTPEARIFTREEIASWIAEDEADMRRFEAGS